MNENGTERELLKAFYRHIGELTQDYVNNIQQFVHQNSDIAMATEFSIVVGSTSLLNKGDMDIAMGIGRQPSLTALKLTKTLLAREERAEDESN